MWTWKKITSVAAGVVTLAGAATVLGVKEFPRPAWSSEVVELAGSLVELDSRLTSQQLDDTKLRLYQNQREQRKADREENQIPLFLLKEQTDLERIIDDLETRLNKLRATQ